MASPTRNSKGPERSHQLHRDREADQAGGNGQTQGQGVADHKEEGDL